MSASSFSQDNNASQLWSNTQVFCLHYNAYIINTPNEVIFIWRTKGEKKNESDNTDEALQCKLEKQTAEGIDKIETICSLNSMTYLNQFWTSHIGRSNGSWLNIHTELA